MKISYNWLKEYYPTSQSAEETASMLTACGLEVEGITEFESIKGGLKGLVTGKVLTCIKHPDADKLSLTTVDTGSGDPAQIVCGAPNVAAGQKVIVAVPGTKIFPLSGEPFVIKQAKIRGQLSQGMICAEDEIGLGTSHEGIIILPEDTPVGIPAADFFKIKSDAVFEIGLTPNRADAASHIGVARDLSAVINTTQLIETGKEIKSGVIIPKVTDLKPGKTLKEISVVIEDTEACPRYSGISITNIKVESSPSWLKDRLTSIGVNPINNIVDITNYVLHECGQPLHAFDADTIGGKKIVVRSARQHEKFITLDKIERTLSSGDLMICDESKPLCIAGVFGGINSGISEKTTTVFLESACFNPASIRKTGKRHGLKTDASFRFERGTDPELTIYALKRAAEMMCEIAGGEIASDITDTYPVPAKPARINFSLKHLYDFGGQVIDKKIVKTILESLLIKIVSEKEDTLELEIPLFKVDVTRQADVVEEILRVYGYDRIPVPQKINASLPKTVGFDKEKIQVRVSEFLADNGFHEAVTNSLTKSEYGSLPGWDESELVKILNPLSQELSVMRQDLLTNMLETIQYNINRKNNDLRMFEFGKTYLKNTTGYSEQNNLAIVMTGRRSESSWRQKDANVDFYFLKSFVENVISVSGISNYKISEGDSPEFESSLSVNIANDTIATFGNIKKSFLKKFDVGQDVFYAKINWDAVLKNARKKPVQYKEISKFPPVKRDLSMQISSDVEYAKLESIAYNTEKKLLRDIRLFDVYSGDKIESGKKSYAMSFILQDDEQTLTENQISKVMDKLMAAFEREAGAVIRKN